MKAFFLIAVSLCLLTNVCACAKRCSDSAGQGAETHAADSSLAFDNAHNSRNSLDWPGVYEGVIPAADAAGIKVRLVLNENGTFKMSSRYLGKSKKVYTDTGTFRWDDAGGAVILDVKNMPPKYIVGENALIQLDMNGERITGAFADNYILKKKQ